MEGFNNTFRYKLIYIFRINDSSAHKGCLKIGDATIDTNKMYYELLPNCHDLNYAARKRIDEYTSTAGIGYELLYTEIAVYKVNNQSNKKYGRIIAFRDHDVHRVLKRSNIKVKYFDTHKKQNEWFVVDLETAKRAIRCVKEEKHSLGNDEITHDNNPIVFRPEQLEAIKKTVKRFKDSDKMLWNAKMRFGKTLTALQVAKEMNFKTTIIITHRPVVSDGWYDDFKKIFYDKPEYQFGSKTFGESSIKKLINSNKPFVYFASIQDLRGSSIVGGKFDKNNEIFDIAWDFIVVDEAHEGTQTSLGKNVLEELINNKYNKNPKVLELSGTPFNLLTDFEEASIYTWDYIMEQEAKQNWHLNHFGDSNPYEELPIMNIYTYHLEKYLTGFMDIEDKAFNFKEFFRTWTGDIKKDFKQLPCDVNIGDFVHEKDIISFLDLICKKSNTTNYPFATEEYRDFFRHTLWVLPGVKEAKALSKLLKKHHIFKCFDIVNVAGDGDEEIDTNNALYAVKKAMTNHPESTYTITLSCGRLTTGVSVPEWTAVLMLAGSYSTVAAQYLQTIFRVQTPANIDGKIKENCYVFDFAPDRTLKMIAESVQLSAKTKSKNPIAEQQLQMFLNFCPVISVEGTNMKEFKVGMLLQELKKAYTERVVKNGFDDSRLYNDELLKLDDVAIDEFEKLKKVVGASKVKGNINDIEINNEGFTKEEYEKIEKAEKKTELTEEEKELQKKRKKQNENRQKAISILRAISIRMPLLVYGMDGDIDTEITIDNFVDLVDDISWNEFMPTGVNKEMFKKFSKYYDKDMFIACARRIRYISKTADELEPFERITKIAELFSTFKNPDKETVLTPWNVVNMHLVQILGGYSFYDEKFSQVLEEPRYVSYDNVTNDTLCNGNATILDINSKTGLYPLFVAYSLYRTKCDSCNQELSFDEKLEIWDGVINNNIYVICKTKMAKLITRRTLLGYRKGKINAHAFDDLIMQLKDKPDKFVDKVLKKSFWGKGEGQMKFNAIVGNPPYQMLLEGNKMSLNIYHEFVRASVLLSPNYVSLITPSKWMAGELGPYKEMKGFFDFFVKGNHLKLIHDFASSMDVFKGVDIKGGISFFLYDNLNSSKLEYFLHENGTIYTDIRQIEEDDTTIIRFPLLVGIIEKVKRINKNESMNSIVSSWNPYGFISDFFEKNNENVEQFDFSSNEHDVLIYGLLKGKRLTRYISRKDLIKDTGGFDKYKVFVPRANGSGAFGEKFSTPILGLPIQISTDTFLEVGPFDTEQEAASCLKYIKTKFFRALVGAKKTGVFNYKDAFKYVPVEIFIDNSDIDWSKSISEIDQQLYAKYNLSQEEIDFIETKVKPM